MKRLLLLLIACAMLGFAGVGVGDATEPIRQGAKGEEIVRIQMRLFDLGYYTYKPTGSFQTVTRAAVIAYQLACGLMSDGSVGQETLEQLFLRGAKRVDFRAGVPLSYTAQGPIQYHGKPTPWKTVRQALTEDTAYRVRNAATGADVMLQFVSGENHAEMTLPSGTIAERNAAVSALTDWLGSANSFYKCAVLFELDGQWIAASMQWNGEDHVCIYFTDSRSHVHDFPDAEHEANIRKAAQ
jgi:hypothetical protein